MKKNKTTAAGFVYVVGFLSTLREAGSLKGLSEENHWTLSDQNIFMAFLMPHQQSKRIKCGKGRKAFYARTL